MEKRQSFGAENEHYSIALEYSGSLSCGQENAANELPPYMANSFCFQPN